MMMMMMKLTTIFILLLLFITTSIHCLNSTVDDYSYDDDSASTATTTGHDYEEDSNYDYSDDENDTANTDQQQPYKCPEVCICKFNKIDDTATTTSAPHETANDYDYDYSTKDSYEIDVDCSNRSLSTFGNLFDDEFPIESIVKLNLSSNLFESLKISEFELLQSLKILDVSSNLKLRSLPTVNLLKNFQDLHELRANDLQLSQNFCLNCKAVRRHFGYFNKTGIEVSLDNVRCGQSGDLTLQACFQEDDEILKMEPRQNQIIFEGDPVSLKCRAMKQLTNNTIRWYLNNTLVTDGVQIKENSSYSELNVPSVIAWKHTGSWKCVGMLTAEHRVKAEIFIQVLVTMKSNVNVVSCPDLITVTTRGAFKWNKTSDLNRTIEQRCVINADKVARYECRLQSDNKTATWMNLNVSECEYESNLTRYLNSLLKNSTDVNLNFRINMTKSTIIDYQLIIQLLQAKFRLGNANLGKFLLDYYNFLSNQTLDMNNFADFSPFEFDLHLRAFFQMLNFYVFSLNSTLSTQYLSVKHPSMIIYRQSNLISYYLRDIALCSTIVSLDHTTTPVNKTIQFEINSTPSTSTLDNDLAVLMTKFNWKRIKFFNYKDRFKDNLQNYDLIYTLNSPTLQHWQTYSGNNTQFKCEFDSLNKNQTLLITKCQFRLKQRVNLALKWSNNTQNELKFYYFNEKFIYFSSILSFLLLLTNIVAYLVNNKQILMPDKFKHCLLNIWSCQLIQIVLQLLLLIQIDLKPLCIVNSLLEHIFILSTFLWYFIYIYELYKKLVKLYEGNLQDGVPQQQQQQQCIDDDETENGDEEIKKHKPIVHLYMIALALPVFLCLISYTSTPKYINFEFSYCFLTQLDILLITFILPIAVCLILVVIFTILILRVYNMIMKNLEEEEMVEVKESDDGDGGGGDGKFSNQFSNDDSVMDTQYRPRVQLAFILITLILYVLMQVSLQLEIYKTKIKFIDEQSDSVFIYCYSLLLLVYSIITFSFYFLTRNDTFNFDFSFKRQKNYYFEQAKVALPPYDTQSVSSESGSCEKREMEEVGVVTPNNSQEEEKSIESEAVVEAKLCLLNDLIQKEEQENTDVDEEEGTGGGGGGALGSIHYIDATTTTATATASNYSFGTSDSSSQPMKRKTHVRNGSVLSGQFNCEQQMIINSIVQQEPPSSKPQTQSTATLNRRGAPIYVYVDHNYEDKVIRKLKSPINSPPQVVVEMKQQQQQQQQPGIWLNMFYESDKPPFKHETSV